MQRWTSLISACGLFWACNEDPITCTLAACGSAPVVIHLVDEAGDPVNARGEDRLNQNSPEPFDCSGEPHDSGPLTLPCTDGVTRLWSSYIIPADTLEFRFERADGSMTDWQPVNLALTKHTDPDFNGPGCPCTWYDATAAPIVVPPGARLPPVDR